MKDLSVDIACVNDIASLNDYDTVNLIAVGQTSYKLPTWYFVVIKTKFHVEAVNLCLFFKDYFLFYAF